MKNTTALYLRDLSKERQQSYIDDINRGHYGQKVKQAYIDGLDIVIGRATYRESKLSIA